MKYSDTTSLSGIIQEEERLTGLGYAAISGNTTLLKEFTSLNNIEGNKVLHLIHSSTGNWIYDDSNHDDLPTATSDLVENTSVYAIPSDALTIKRIEVKDSAGNWYKLQPISLEQINSEGEFFSVSGRPIYFRLINDTLEVYPATNYNSSNGLRVFYDRAGVDFLTTDTTKTPGFASLYHTVIPIGASLAWLKVKIPNSPQIPLLEKDYQKLELNIKQFYGQRFKDKKSRVGRAYKSYK